MPASRRLLLVHAHPDDETLGTGATMARYAAEGAHVTLVTCTLGEEGEIIPDELAHLAADREDALGPHRIGELAAACAALGVSDHRFLGGAGRWRDSGMHGTPPNEHPRAFWQADREEAVLALVTILRETRPQVVITYDARGGYGHPDHIQAHRITVEAVRCAGDPTYAPEAGPAWTVSKLYWTAVPVSVLQDGVEQVRAAGRFTAVASAADLAFGNPDDEVTTAIDAAAYLPAKLAAMRAHATQISVDEPYFALSDHVGHVARGTEHYVLRDGVITERETDLFGGVDTSLDTPNG